MRASQDTRPTLVKVIDKERERAGMSIQDLADATRSLVEANPDDASLRVISYSHLRQALGGHKDMSSGFIWTLFQVLELRVGRADGSRVSTTDSHLVRRDRSAAVA